MPDPGGPTMNTIRIWPPGARSCNFSSVDAYSFWAPAAGSMMTGRSGLLSRSHSPSCLTAASPTGFVRHRAVNPLMSTFAQGDVRRRPGVDRHWTPRPNLVQAGLLLLAEVGFLSEDGLDLLRRHGTMAGGRQVGEEEAQLAGGAELRIGAVCRVAPPVRPELGPDRIRRRLPRRVRVRRPCPRRSATSWAPAPGTPYRVRCAKRRRRSVSKGQAPPATRGSPADAYGRYNG